MCDRRNPVKGFRQGWHIERRASRLRRAGRSEVHSEHSGGGAERARIQPVERTAEEHLQRLRHDIDTVLQLQLYGWSDEAWAPVAEALAEYGVGVLTGWLYTREIFVQVARGSFGGLRQCPDSWLFDDNGDTITGLAGVVFGCRFAVESVTHRPVVALRLCVLDPLLDPCSTTVERDAALPTLWTGTFR